MPELNACPMCGSDKGQKRATSQYYRKCDGCGFIYLHEPPRPEEVIAFYVTGAYRESRSMTNLMMDADEKHRAMKYADLIDSGYNHLDIGCSRGYMLEATRHKGFDILGVELNPDYPFSDIPFVSDLSKVEGQWDNITCIHTLEHVFDFKGMAERITELLSPGGNLFVEVPSLSVDGGGFNAPAHLWYFTIDNLKELFSGLQPVKVGDTPHHIIHFTKEA